MQLSKGTKVKVNWALSFAWLLVLLPAHANDSAAISPPPQAEVITTANPVASDRVYWPMMPGESLAQLATSLYPNSTILQQRFIKKTLSLSRALDTPVSVNQPFSHPGLLIIPNEKAVKELTHRIRKSEEVRQDEEQLRLSYRLKTRPIPAPASLEPAKQPASMPAMPAVETPVSATTMPADRPNTDDDAAQSAQDVSTTHDESPPAAMPKATHPPQATIARQEAGSVGQQATPDEPKGWALPEFFWPQWRWPALDWPDIRLPTVDWQGYWDVAVSRVQAGYNNSVDAVKKLNQQALLLQQEYASKNVVEVLHDYRLRNIALISVLGVLFLLIGLLHRKRARKQREMLSLIKDTINHDVEFTLVIPASISAPSAQNETTVTDATVGADNASTVDSVYEQRGYH